MPPTMLQSILRAPLELELCEVPTPEPAAGELIVRVDLAMTCGTDLKTYRRGHPKFPCPTPLGHEFTGTVTRVGRGVTPRFREGDPILAVPSAPCGRCRLCEQGLENLCEHVSPASMAWGAFADCVRVPAHVVRRNVFHRPRGLDLRQAALLEPLSCAVAAAERLDLRRTDTALVLGAGPMGLLFVSLLKQRVPRVVVLGRRDVRLDAARDMGADVVLDLDAEEDPQAALREVAPPGACTVVECVGRPEAWALAVESARRGGEVMFFGGCPAGTTVPLDTQRMHYDGLTLKGHFHFSPSDVRVALDLIQSGALPLERLVTGEYGLEQLDDALASLIRGEGIKLAIRPGDNGF